MSGFAVVMGEGPAGEAFTDVFFITWVDVVGGSDVVDDGHAAVGDGFEGAAHFVLDDDPVAFDAGFGGGLAVVGELDEVE